MVTNISCGNAGKYFEWHGLVFPYIASILRIEISDLIAFNILIDYHA